MRIARTTILYAGDGTACVTIPVAAARRRVTTQAVRKAILTGALIAIVVGRRTVVTTESLDGWRPDRARSSRAKKAARKFHQRPQRRKR